MKRMQLFEFEDFNWFPQWMRIRIARLVEVTHHIFDSKKEILALLKPLAEDTATNLMVDLCSGNGGIMPEVIDHLVFDDEMSHLSLTLTDIHPDMLSAKKYQPLKYIAFYTKPVNAIELNENFKGLRTMISSFHHFAPIDAKAILKSAEDSKTPIFIYEMSNNNTPKYLWWLALPIIFIICFFITPMVRPMTWQQIVFTYIIPIIPMFFAWDMAVSHARTYTLKDIEVLLEGLGSSKYKWTSGQVGERMKKIYLIGQPIEFA